MNCLACGNPFEGVAGTPCPQCGSVNASTDISQDPGAPPAGDPGPPPPAPDPDGPAWERQRSLGAMLETIKGVLIEPGDTFRNASRTAGIGPALMFGLILGLAGSIIGLFWQYFMGAAFGGGLGSSPFGGGLPPEFADILPGPTTLLILSLAMAPVFLLIGLFLWSAIVHLMLLLLGGASQGYEATFRTIAYCSGSTALFQAVPFCGGWVGGIWSLVAQIVCLKEMHHISGGKAAAAVLVPLVLCCCTMVALVLGIGIFVGTNVASGF